MIHRREVDGLRALAVVPVILFHAGLGVFSGGFAGVDVFFVISGYLITSIIVADLDAGRFSLAAFYERRARRILPALLLVVAVTMPLAWLWMLPADLLAFARSVLAVLVFGSNLLFWRESGYFNSAADLKPLLHTWSLAVEEQFYLLFPLLLLLAWRWGRRRTAVLLALLTAASLAAAQWAVSAAPSAAFFLLPTRAWELGLGALVALHLARQHAWRPGPLLQQCLAGAGLLLILCGFVVFTRYTPFPGLHALVPTTGTALVLLFAWPGTLAGSLLGHRLLVGIGLLSYSAYLWHQPLLALARHRQLDEVGPGLSLALCAATFVLAALSWRLVETPFRNRAFIARRPLVATLLGVALVLGLAAAAGVRATQARLPDSLRATHERCNHDQDRCFEKAPAARRVALWGDSYADVIAKSLGDALNARGGSLALFIKQSCPSIPGTVRNEAKRLGPGFAAECAAHNERALAAILGGGVDDLVVTNSYQWYLTGRNADGDPILLDAEVPGASPAQFVPARLAKLVQLANQRGIRVFVITPHPLVRNFQQVRKALHRGLALAPDIDLAGASGARQILLSGLQLPSAGVVEIDGRALYCTHGQCRITDRQGRMVLHDGAHLSSGLADLLAGRLAEVILPSGQDAVPGPSATGPR